jgi:hypothetical protein
MEPTECSETSAFNIQTPGKYPEETLPYLQHGESLKTTILHLYEKETASHIRLIVKMKPTECYETSAFNIQTPGKYPEENLPYLQHGESLKTTT